MFLIDSRCSVLALLVLHDSLNYHGANGNAECHIIGCTWSQTDVKHTATDVKHLMSRAGISALCNYYT
jgi:hypothetical protein